MLKQLAVLKLLVLATLGATTAPMATKTEARVAFDSLMPGVTDRAAFVGQTGSGKTTLAENICKLRPYVVVLDPKGTVNWQGYELHRNLDSLTQSKAAKLTYRPVYDELANDETMDLFFRWVFERRNTTLYVDEIYAVAHGDVYPPHYGACLTRGREVGVVVYTATQRPAFVPQIMFSESEHVYCFYLKMPRDRERVEAMTGIDKREIHSLPKHRFLYAPQDGEPVGPLTLRLARNERG